MTPNGIKKIRDKSEVAKKVLNFTREEQEYNIRLCRQYIFYDRALCNELCDDTNDEQCKEICYNERNASPELSRICPFGNPEPFDKMLIFFKISTARMVVLANIINAEKSAEPNEWDTGV